MSALTVSQSKTALATGLTASFLASGGTPPYTYAVRSGGAGGSINSATGIYTSPATVSTNPAKLYDTIIATDSLGNTGTAQVLVGNALLLFCEIIQHELDLPSDRVYLWQQKNFQPIKGDGIYVPVSVVSCRAFSNITKPAIIGGVPDWSQQVQATNFYSVLDLNIISRDISALYQKESVVMAIQSIYSRQQQEANSFFIGKIPTQFNDLSFIDGAAIPYRFQISLAIQYAVTNVATEGYIDDFTAGVQEVYNT